MIKVIVLVVCILLLCSADILSEDLQQGFGFTAGRISGVGIAYRQYFDKNGIQVTFGMFSNREEIPKFPTSANYGWEHDGSNTKIGWELVGSYSLMYLRTLRMNEETRFYYFLGASMELDYKKKYTQDYENGIAVGIPVEKNAYNHDYFFGPGLGIDFKVNDNISFVVELPISISSDLEIETYIPQGGIVLKF